jgi:hypothetical protein
MAVVLHRFPVAISSRRNTIAAEQRRFPVAFTTDTLIKELMANPQARAILEKHVPGFSNNPQIHLVQDMSLNSLATYPAAGAVKENLQAIAADLAKL